MSKPRDIADSAATINFIDGVTSAVQTQLDAKATYPSQSGQSGKFLTTNGSAVSWGEAGGGYTVVTPVSASGVSELEFTNIPAGTTRVIVNFYRINYGNNTSATVLSLGTSSGYIGSNYRSYHRQQQGASTFSSGSSNSYAYFSYTGTQYVMNGQLTMTLADSSNNYWIGQGFLQNYDGDITLTTNFAVPITNALTKIKVIGGSSWTAGQISIAYI